MQRLVMADLSASGIGAWLDIVIVSAILLGVPAIVIAVVMSLAAKVSGLDPIGARIRIAFVLSLACSWAWFAVNVGRQTTSSCFGLSHYTPSAVLFLVGGSIVQCVISAVIPPRSTLAGAVEVVTAALLNAVGLFCGIFFLGVASCSA
jgi:hypothetical protein